MAVPRSSSVFMATLQILSCLGATSMLHAEDAPKAGLPPGFINEAPLPEGFPLPGPVGELTEKQYPVIRAYSATGPAAFMSCFGYLSKHKHEMTAPVVMESPASKTDQAQTGLGSPIAVGRMSFLLEKNSLDDPKTEGVVTVADIPGLRVLSVAFQGALDPASVKEAEAKLTAKLGERTDLEDAGPTRILGYNSPFVPRAKQYWEIQKPVRAKGSGETPKTAPPQP